MIQYELMQHQKDAVWKASLNKDLYLAWDMGTGKSCAIINILRRKFVDANGLLNTLILAPVIVLKNWKAEFAMYSKIEQRAIVVLEGPVKKRIQAVKESQGPRIFITNYDALQDTTFAKALMEWKPHVLVCDESHVLKNYKSKRAKNVAAISDHCKHRYLLSGTPILNNALDLFMQFRVLDGYDERSSTFGKNFFVFRAKYFEDENATWSARPGYFPRFVPRPETYELLNKKIYSKTMRVKKTEVLKNLPPFTEEQRYVELSIEQARLYKEMKRDFVTFVNDKLKTEIKAVVAKLAMTKALRLQQIVSGFVKTEDGEILRIAENPRLDYLKELLSDLTPEHKVIVWSIFKENYVQISEICQELKIGYTELHGNVSPKDKFKNVDTFNKEENCRVLIGNPGAGGIGINLVGASYSLYYTRGFKLADDLQSEARNYRKGSEIHEKITRINLIAPNTIDELVAEALAKKLNISDLIIDRMNDL